MLLPGPIDVLRSIGLGVSDGTLLVAAAASFRRLLIGYLIAVGLGISIGLILGRSSLLRETFGSLVLGFQTVPSVVWLPLALVWFGFGDLSIIVVVVLGTIWTVITNTESGVRTVSPLLIRAASTMGARGTKLFLNVILPASVPSIITGMRMAWSFAWRALLPGELIGSGAGLGQVLMIGRNLGDLSLVMAVAALIFAAGSILDQLVFRRVEDRVMEKWGLAQARRGAAG